MRMSALICLTAEAPPESVVGATPAQLASWGYETTEVPDVDARVDACMPLTGSAQFECLAGVDQYLMTEVVPWTPLATRRHVAVAGPRLAAYSWSAAAGTPAFDRLAVAP